MIHNLSLGGAETTNQFLFPCSCPDRWPPWNKRLMRWRRQGFWVRSASCHPGLQPPGQRPYQNFRLLLYILHIKAYQTRNMHQSINERINESMNQSINEGINESIRPSPRLLSSGRASDAHASRLIRRVVSRPMGGFGWSASQGAA